MPSPKLPDAAKDLGWIYRKKLPGWENVAEHAITTSAAHAIFTLADVEYDGPSGASTSLLAEMCRAGRCDHAEILLRSGVSPDLGAGLWHLALATSRSEHIDAAKLLLGYGADMDLAPDPKKNINPFLASIKQREGPELSTLLLAHGASFEIAGADSALDEAIVRGWSGLFESMVLTKSEDPDLGEELRRLLEWTKKPGIYCRPKLAFWLQAFMASRKEKSEIDVLVSSCVTHGAMQVKPRL